MNKMIWFNIEYSIKICHKIQIIQLIIKLNIYWHQILSAIKKKIW